MQMDNDNINTPLGLAKLFTLAAVWILVFLALFFLSTNLLFFCNVEISAWSFFPPLILSLPVDWFLAYRAGFSKQIINWIALGLVLLVFLLSIAVSGAIFDVSWDGMDYQQRSIYQLANGYNPVYDVAEPAQAYYNVWLNHYPKGPWIFGAALYIQTDNIETGKSLHWILLTVATFLNLSFFFRQSWLNVWEGAIAGLLLAFNPVSLNQVFSMYIDGMVASILIIVVLTFLLYKHLEASISWILLASSIIIGLNIKFTATAYLVVFAGLGFLILIGITRSPSFSLRLISSLAFGGLLGIFIVGYNPYITNTMRNGNPFYPVWGGEEYNQAYIIQNQAPADFANQSQWIKLGRSFFSRSGNIMGEGVTELKTPFAVNRDELVSFSAVDVRISGFGPWFSGLLLLSTLILLLGFNYHPKRAMLFLGLLIAVAGTTFINAENWWARYSPQFWWLPGIILTFGFSLKARPIRILSGLLAIAMVANLGMVFGPYLIYNLRTTHNISTQLEVLISSKEPIPFYIGPFQGWSIRLDKYQVPYSLVGVDYEMTCPQTLPLATYSPLTCP